MAKSYKNTQRQLEGKVETIDEVKKADIEAYLGYSISSKEYERRFKGVDLDHFRKVMAPDLFKAYVQTMGSIEGWDIELGHLYKGKD